MDTRYQIFISSTYTDLKRERDEVTKTILTMGHIPVGMEMFSAADEEQWATIQREIDRSDYYVVIIAHRYGSTIEELGGIGYTEREYDYAASIGIPRIGFVIQDGVPWPPEFIDGGKSKKRLDAFKGKVKGKPVDFWADATHLGARVSMALSKAFNVSPQPGWGRNTEGSTRALEAMAALSEENRGMRAELERLRAMTSEQVPQLDVRFVGSRDPHRLEKASAHSRDFNAFVAKITPEARQLAERLNRMTPFTPKPKPQMPYGLPVIEPLTADLTTPFILAAARYQRTRVILKDSGIELTNRTWKFHALHNSKFQFLNSPYLETPKPTGGEDLDAYTVFAQLERIANSIQDASAQQQQDNTTAVLSIEALNLSRIPAADLTVRLEFNEGTVFNIRPELPEYEAKVHEGTPYSVQVPLIAPQDHNSLPPVRVWMPNDGQPVQFQARITGRNLPEAQVVPLEVVWAEPQGNSEC